MAEIADEPDEYLSDEETGSVSNTKEKGSSRGAAKYRTKFNTEREGSYPVNVFKAIHIRFGVFLAINVFGAITKD